MINFEVDEDLKEVQNNIPYPQNIRYLPRKSSFSYCKIPVNHGIKMGVIVSYSGDPTNIAKYYVEELNMWTSCRRQGQKRGVWTQSNNVNYPYNAHFHITRR